jgi:hypothetical protein
MILAGIALGLVGPALPQSDPPTPTEPFAKRELERYLHYRERLEEERIKKAGNPQGNFDAIHYNLILDIDIDGEAIAGTVDARVVLLGPAPAEVIFDLHDDMTVSGVREDGVPVSFSHASDLLTARLGQTHGAGDTITLSIDYSGAPDVLNNELGIDVFTFGTHPLGDTQPIIFTLSEPFFARSWWPCKDVPSDKATVRIKATVPDTLVVASNGVLQSETDLGAGRKQYEWLETYPIATYLVSLAISNYRTFIDYFNYSPTDSMRVDYYVFAEDFADAQIDFSVTVPMLEHFSSLFGLYPFTDEKYAMAEVTFGGFGGAMEHQTCTSYGGAWITGNNYQDWAVAHELAHQWWGNMISVADWREIWLSEGFASYSEALWEERVGGFDAYRSWVTGRRSAMGFKGTLYDPPVLFDVADVYWRGAWVLHMLRRVMGDASFFEALRAYAADARFAYRNATTADFRKVCEQYYGESLAWFFDQWVFSWNECPAGIMCEPVEYEYFWRQTSRGSSQEIELTIWQTQTGSLIRMPVDIRLTMASGDTSLVVWNSRSVEKYVITMPEAVLDLAIDPDEWILRSVSPREFSSFPDLNVYPNPFNSGTVISFETNVDGNVTLEIYDVSGARIRVLHNGPLAVNFHEIAWDGRNGDGQLVASGVYFVRLNTPQRWGLRKAIVVR